MGKRRTMSFTAEADIVDEFKEFCKARGINQSTALNAFMWSFKEERLSMQYEDNRLVIVGKEVEKCQD